MSLSCLKRLAEPVRGVRPSFSFYHVYLALISLYQEAPLGRVALARRLLLGEASVKTLIRRMRSEGIVEVDKVAGVFLTQKGLEIVSHLRKLVELIGPLELRSVCGDCRAYGAILKRLRYTLAERVGYLKIRDLIVREGAEGAIVIYCGPEPLMPVSGGFDMVTGVLRDTAIKHCGDGDVMVISICRNTEEECAAALVNATLRLLDP